MHRNILRCAKVRYPVNSTVSSAQCGEVLGRFRYDTLVVGNTLFIPDNLNKLCYTRVDPIRSLMMEYWFVAVGNLNNRCARLYPTHVKVYTPQAAETILLPQGISHFLNSYGTQGSYDKLDLTSKRIVHTWMHDIYDKSMHTSPGLLNAVTSMSTPVSSTPTLSKYVNKVRVFADKDMADEFYPWNGECYSTNSGILIDLGNYYSLYNGVDWKRTMCTQPDAAVTDVANLITTRYAPTTSTAWVDAVSGYIDRTLFDDPEVPLGDVLDHFQSTAPSTEPTVDASPVSNLPITAPYTCVSTFNSRILAFCLALQNVPAPEYEFVYILSSGDRDDNPVWDINFMSASYWCDNASEVRAHILSCCVVLHSWSSGIRELRVVKTRHDELYMRVICFDGVDRCFFIDLTLLPILSHELSSSVDAEFP